jgi:hypothetical protein
MDVGASNEMITPHVDKKKRARDGAADAAGLVFDCELAGVLQGDAGGVGVVPAATDDNGGVRVGHRVSRQPRLTIIGVGRRFPTDAWPLSSIIYHKLEDAFRL